MNHWKSFALLAGICAIPVAAWACQPPASLPRVSVSVNGHTYPITTHIRTYRTPNGVVRIETLSWHAPNGTGSVVSDTETGRALPDAPDAPLPSSLRNTMNTMMAQMQMMQTQFTQMFSRMNQVFAAAFSPPAMSPLNRPNHLMQTSAHSVTRAPLGDHGSAVLM
ncbi:MAG: hypothetical protein ACYDDA_07070 [Acidiferrobacteraceae bacterium]